MLTFDFIYTVLLIVLMTAALIREWFETDLVVFSVLILLTLGGVLSIQEAFAGFSNHGMLTVAVLFVVAGSVKRAGVLERLGDVLLGRGTSITKKLLRFMFPVSAASAFFNNTPIVAVLIPVVRSWARKYDLSVSKFLIPLSYAAILGGTCTLIGTSTNLVVHGLIIEGGMEGFSFFEISRIGIPVTILGVLAVALIGHRILPDRKEPVVQLGEQTREFVVAMKVSSEYQNVNKTIQKAGLRHLKGLFLFQIERKGKNMTPVGPDEIIRVGDRLFFTGLPETIMELQRTPGLSLLKEAPLDLKNDDNHHVRAYEVVVSRNSPLIGKNVRESHFRSHYGAVIVAIHRSGERIRKKIGDVVLRSGDTLLILADPSFLSRWYHSRDFYLVSESIPLKTAPGWKSWFSGAVLVGMIVVMAMQWLPVLTAASAGAVLLLLARCISPSEARQSIEWGVLLVIASALGIARALENSGVAYFLAEQLMHSMGTLGIMGLVAGIYFMTSLYTTVITNNAAAALVFPVAFSVTQQAGIDPRPFFLAVAMAASTSFASPVGYQTNLMVYGPGGYKFRDFLKIGIPMNLFVGIIAVTLIYFYFYH